MKLLFTFQKQRILYPINTTTITNNESINEKINPKYINSNIQTPITSSFGSIFERIKHTGKCNSCSGAR